MVAQSQSGTGKTVAFLTASLSRVDFTQPEQPQALILAPTQELADQIYRNIHTIGRFVENLKVALAIPQKIPRGESVKASVVVGTPGTVLDLGRRKQLDGSKLKVLVLDEADNMLDQAGLGDQCLRVKLQYVPNDIPTCDEYNKLTTSGSFHLTPAPASRCCSSQLRSPRESRSTFPSLPRTQTV